MARTLLEGARRRATKVLQRRAERWGVGWGARSWTGTRSGSTTAARAGKWKEKKIDAPAGDSKGEAVKVATRGELEVDQVMLLRVGDRRIVLGRTEEGYVAFDDSCTHRGASLADGVMICGTVQCPWHGSQFDVKTGKRKAGPAEKGIEV